MAKKEELLYLSRRDVKDLLDYPSCIALMKTAMQSVAKGEAVQPIRSAVSSPGGSGLLGMMPGAMADPEILGIKTVTVFPGNFQEGLPSHQGFVSLFDAQNGTPLALMDASVITAIRTACASAAATQLLARRNAQEMTVMGYGEQAETHIAAIKLVRDLTRIVVWGRDEEKAKKFARAQSDLHGIEINAVLGAQQAVEGADIICTLTASSTPILKGAWLAPGMHVNVVGSGMPSACEVDALAVKRAKFYTDYTASVKALGGEYRAALVSGEIDENHIIGEVGEIMMGTRPGRESESDLTMFKSLGMVTEDLVSAHFLYHQAKTKNVGAWLDL